MSNRPSGRFWDAWLEAHGSPVSSDWIVKWNETLKGLLPRLRDIGLTDSEIAETLNLPNFPPPADALKWNAETVSIFMRNIEEND